MPMSLARWPRCPRCNKFFINPDAETCGHGCPVRQPPLVTTTINQDVMVITVYWASPRPTTSS